MTGHAWQQQAMLNKLGAITQQRLQIQQQQSDKTALKVTRLGGLFSRKPHYELPPEVQSPTVTLLLQKPLKLHDIEVIHITFERQTLENWLEKGGEIRGKLNGIGFALTLNMEVDAAQHLVVRDISLQGSRLSLPGNHTPENMPGEIRQQLTALDEEWHQQHNRFSEQQKCLFVNEEWLGRIEASLQDVAVQIKQAQQC